MEIDGIKVCEPIKKLIALLERHHFVIIKQSVSDYHFHEVAIVMKGHSLLGLEDIRIRGIQRVNPNLFVCVCNWSTVKLECQ